MNGLNKHLGADGIRLHVHIAFFARGQISSAKQVLGSRKMVAVFSVPNVNNGWNKAIGNWNSFHENVYHMSRNSSYKISV